METTYLPSNMLEVRDVGAGVHELEGLCVPYDTPTTKAGPLPEVFRPGAFATAVAAAAKIRLIDNNHATGARRPVGVGVHLEERSASPAGGPGLWGRFRFYNTPEGRAAFENVSEGTYGGLSIGFVAVRENRASGTREVLEARLHHVSLVDEPAYDDAQIVAVRAAADPRYEIFRHRPEPVLAVPDTPLMVQVRTMGSR